MNIAAIVSELRAERTRIERAIVALEGLSPNGAGRGGAARQAKTAGAPRRNHLSAAGRKRISEMMKKRWAERRKKAAAKG